MSSLGDQLDAIIPRQAPGGHEYIDELQRFVVSR
jgi:hypothetical protein